MPFLQSPFVRAASSVIVIRCNVGGPGYTEAVRYGTSNLNRSGETLSELSINGIVRVPGYSDETEWVKHFKNENSSGSIQLDVAKDLFGFKIGFFFSSSEDEGGRTGIELTATVFNFDRPFTINFAKSFVQNMAEFSGRNFDSFRIICANNSQSGRYFDETVNSFEDIIRLAMSYSFAAYTR
jgi:hypothetical protein